MLAREVSRELTVDAVLYGHVVCDGPQSTRWGWKTEETRRLFLYLIDRDGHLLWKDQLPFLIVTGTKPALEDSVQLSLTRHFMDHVRELGLDTAGYVTGYRGSPLGTLDQQFVRAQRHLDRYDIRFQAGINEDIAATALWGSQQAELRGEGKFDGVFGLWYGKGPGVDRTGDVFRHANFAGTSRHGGVLALMGDDHTAESSTTRSFLSEQTTLYAASNKNPEGARELAWVDFCQALLSSNEFVYVD